MTATTTAPARPGPKPKPADQKAVRITLTLSREQAARLRKLAESRSMTHSGLVQQWIERAR